MFSFKLETIFYAVNIVDRYLADLVTRDEVSPCLLQLGLTCLRIAAKLEEHKRPALELYIKHIKARFNVQLLRKDLLDLEMRILKSLKFNIRYDTPIFFLERFFRIFEVDAND